MGQIVRLTRFLHPLTFALAHVHLRQLHPQKHADITERRAPHVFLPAQAPMKQLYHTSVGAPYALSTGS